MYIIPVYNILAKENIVGTTKSGQHSSVYPRPLFCNFPKCGPGQGATSSGVQLLYKALHYAHEYQLGLQTM